MKKIIILLIFSITSFVYADDIAYIDLNLILQKSLIGKSLDEKISKMYETKNENNLKIEKQLQEEEKLIKAKKNIINQKEYQKLVDNFRLKVGNYRKEKNNFIDEMNQIKKNSTEKVFKQLDPIIKKYVNDNEISIILNKENVIVGKKNLDITSNIIELLDKNFKELNSNEN